MWCGASLVHFLLKGNEKNERELQMDKSYSFLRDELALAEIRKHKWIESEKVGCEIGFATAALDWINKHGKKWRNYRLSLESKENIFSEKRQYRRFSHPLPLILKSGHYTIHAKTNNFNLVGLSCTVPHYIPESASAEVLLSFPKSAESPETEHVQFTSQVQRISSTRRINANLCYEIFLPFNEATRNRLRTNAQLIAA